MKGRQWRWIWYLVLSSLFVAQLSLSLPDAGIGKAGVHCSRKRSRLAWQAIEEYLLPFVENVGYKMSPNCRLHPSNDMFRDQENQKEHMQLHRWQCGYCRKIFQSEEFLDQHFNNRHSDMLNVTRQNCLADLCGPLHCDYMENKAGHKYKKGKCNQGAMDRNRHLCENIANTCFPSYGTSLEIKLNDFFLRQFCDSHTCKKGKKIFPRGSGKWEYKGLYYTACIFVFIVLAIFYGGLYAHRRETNLSVNSLKHLTRHTVSKSKKH